MSDERTRKIVVAGVFGAISAFLAITRLGYLPTIGLISITVMHVPVILAAILEGPIVGLVVGLIFGISSLVLAAVAPVTPADTWFVNPLLSVLPRLFIGPVTAWVWRFFAHTPSANRIAAGALISGVVGSLTNTFLVLGAIGLAGLLPWAALGGVVLTGGLPEAAFAGILSLLVIAAWRKIPIARRQGADL